MITTKTDTSVLEMTRTVRADVERVYKAWTEPEQMMKWFGCMETQAVTVSQDLRVGGNYSVSVQLDDKKSCTMHGTYIEIVPNRKLVYSWTNTAEDYPAKDTLVTVEFVANGAATEIHLVHSKFDKPISVQGHSMGWTAAFDKFEALFA